MADEIDDGGPAFPVRGEHDADSRGMTKREVLAAFAMMGDLASQGDSVGEYPKDKGSADLLSDRACFFADNLLKHLKEKETKPNG